MLKVSIHSFSYSDKTILRDIQFTLNKGEHISILGESGCGKSTLLHLVYGLLNLEYGSIFYGKKKLLGPLHSLIPGEPFMKLVSQESNLMPFTTVAENLNSHLTGLDEKKDAERIKELLEVVEMEQFQNALVKNLSGGQKQRVALAKALAREPEILLLDEPFSNIDSFRKNRLRRKLFTYLKKANISCLTATHDSEEALSFSHKILMMKNGEIEMFGTPSEVYTRVSDEYQASFFGEVNSLPKNIIIPGESVEEIILFPHQLQYTEDSTNINVEIKECFYKGNHHLIRGDWNGREIFFNHSEKLETGSYVFLQYSPKWIAGN